MFFILSKILDFAINPFFWVVLLFCIGLLGIKKGWKSSFKILLISFLMLLFFTNPLILSLVMNAWETPSYPASDIKTPYEVGILMGGSMRHYDVKNERPVYSMSVDRLMQTIALYKSGKIKLILLTGGSGHVFKQHEKESIYMAEVLKQSGVNENDIIIEDESRNTYENAVFTRDLIAKKNITGKFLLITSAFHMRRSEACFEKVGLRVDSYPVDSKIVVFSLSPGHFIPEPFYFTLWDQLFHEWLGMVAYKFSGYI